MSETPNVYHRVRFVVSGHIKYAPRVVSQFIPGVIKESNRFTVIFNIDLLPDSITKEHITGTMREVHEKVRSLFADGTYTDTDGVIQEFDKPNHPWWIELTNVEYQLGEQVTY
jgi:hypothetical protein